ncbi:MAG TPA: thioredoxin family protein [Candidatus Sericytochromatia bacterium]|jgi:peroxiredoxin
MSIIEKTTTPIGSYAPDFELLGIDEQVHHLYCYLQCWRGVGVVFLCNECSYVCSYIDRLKQIQAQFQNQGFTLVGINANYENRYHEQSLKNMKEFAFEKQLNFPYLWDSTQDVAYSFGVQKIPEAFLIDEMGILRYSGAIDDNVYEPEAVKVSYLQNAIAALFAGAEIFPESTEPTGSPLRWRD